MSLLYVSLWTIEQLATSVYMKPRRVQEWRRFQCFAATLDKHGRLPSEHAERHGNGVAQQCYATYVTLYPLGRDLLLPAPSNLNCLVHSVKIS